MSIPACPPFDEWYQAVNGRAPFPWQARLANQVADNGEWPELVGIPTGLGKTACVDIAVWALAHQADLSPGDRTAPTRIWWVVNRRLLVDDTHRHALRIAALLANPENPPDAVIDAEPLTVDGITGKAAAAVQAVADRLRSIAAGGPPLRALRLRGGDPHNRPDTPAQPAVICSTIPMYGSRVLFRGYGSSRTMRPIDAALAGTDSLVLLDEAHLAQPLRTLLETISGGGFGAGEEQALPGQRAGAAVAALTATGSSISSRFELDDDDLKNATIKERLAAPKPLSIQQHPGGDPAKAIVSAVSGLLGSPDTIAGAGILVFANTPKTALAIAKALRSRRDCDVRVATGRIRGAEVAETVAAISDRLRAGQLTAEGGRNHFVVVATQTLEVGADLDADYLITEACGARALTQRLGRLNRLGKRPHAQGIYVHVDTKDGQWPVYSEEPARVLDQLLKHIGFDESVDMSPGNIAKVLGDSSEEPADAPVLAEALLGEWVKTTTPPPGEAPVEPYFSGRREQDRDVDVIWRAHVPDVGQRIWPRPSTEEIVSVPLHEARKALVGASCVRIAADHTADQIDADRRGELNLRPGDTIIAPTHMGKLDVDGHWNPASRELAMDASLLDNGLVISERTMDGLYGAGGDSSDRKPLRGAMQKLIDSLGGDDPAEAATAAAELCDAMDDGEVPKPFDRDDRREQWRQFVRRLRSGLDEQDGRILVEDPDGEAARLPIRAADVGTGRLVSLDEYDELSISDPVSLQAHGDDTAAAARRTAEDLGITGRTADVVETAARLHDIGKADHRFQDWLDPDQERAGPVAKSKVPRSQWEHRRRASGWPRGGRHEELSRRLAQAWLSKDGHSFSESEQDLLLHLVVAHHGRGRPLVDPVDDQTGRTVAFRIEGREVAACADLSDADWDQPARFARLNSRHGFWGLALLEAILRQADHLASKSGRLEIR